MVGVGATWGIRDAATRRRPGAIGVGDMRVGLYEGRDYLRAGRLEALAMKKESA